MNKHSVIAIAARIQETAALGSITEKKLEWKVPKYGNPCFKFYFGNGKGYWYDVSESQYHTSSLKDMTDPEQMAKYKKEKAK